MVEFMSQSTFDAGGPQPNALGGAAGGLGSLASVIAQGPRIAAQADYQRAQAEHARAQSGLVGQQTEDLLYKRKLLQNRQDMASDLVSTLATPGVMADPNQSNSVLAKAYKFALSDPDAAAHAGQVISTVLAGMRMAQPGRGAQLDAAAASFPGGQAYGSTQTGYEAGLANQRTLENVRQAGEMARKDSDLVLVVPATTPLGAVGSAKTITRGQLKAAPEGTFRELSAAEALKFTEPQTVRPADAKPGTPPVQMSLADSYAKGNQTPISAAQQQAEGEVKAVMTTKGPTYLRSADTVGYPPAPANLEQVQAPAVQAGVFPPPPPPTGVSAAPAPQPPATAPGEPPVPPEPTRTAAELYGEQARLAMAGGKLPSKTSAEAAAEMNQLVSQAAAQHYPKAGGIGGTAGSWGPKATTEILRRAEDYRTRYGTPTFDNVGASLERAIRDLQATGQLPPDATQGPTLGRTLAGAAFTTVPNVVELRPPGGYTDQPAAPAGGAPGSGALVAGAQAAPAQKPAMMHSASTGKYYVQMNGRWVEADPTGRPLQGAAAASPAAPTARRPQPGQQASTAAESWLPGWLQPARREAMRAGVPTTRQVSPARDVRLENGRRMGTVQGQRVPVDEYGFPLDQAETLNAR